MGRGGLEQPFFLDFQPLARPRSRPLVAPRADGYLHPIRPSQVTTRVMEKVGMVYEGVLHKWDVHPNVQPDPRGALCYAIVRPGT